MVLAHDAAGGSATSLIPRCLQNGLQHDARAARSPSSASAGTSARPRSRRSRSDSRIALLGSIHPRTDLWNHIHPLNTPGTRHRPARRQRARSSAPSPECDRTAGSRLSDRATIFAVELAHGGTTNGGNETARGEALLVLAALDGVAHLAHVVQTVEPRADAARTHQLPCLQHPAVTCDIKRALAGNSVQQISMPRPCQATWRESALIAPNLRQHAEFLRRWIDRASCGLSGLISVSVSPADLSFARSRMSIGGCAHSVVLKLSCRRCWPHPCRR